MVVLDAVDLWNSLKFSSFVVIVGFAFASGYGVDSSAALPNRTIVVNAVTITNKLSKYGGDNCEYIFGITNEKIAASFFFILSLLARPSYVVLFPASMWRRSVFRLLFRFSRKTKQTNFRSVISILINSARKHFRRFAFFFLCFSGFVFILIVYSVGTWTKGKKSFCLLKN